MTSGPPVLWMTIAFTMRLFLLRDSDGFEAAASGIERLGAEFFFDTDQLIVFRQPVGARERAGLDLPAIRRNRKIGDSRIFSLAGAMRHDGCVARAMRHFDGGARLGQRADLIDLDQDGIGDLFLDALRQALDIRDEKIVANELAFIPD